MSAMKWKDNGFSDVNFLINFPPLLGFSRRRVDLSLSALLKEILGQALQTGKMSHVTVKRSALLFI